MSLKLKVAEFNSVNMADLEHSKCQSRVGVQEPNYVQVHSVSHNSDRSRLLGILGEAAS